MCLLQSFFLTMLPLFVCTNLTSSPNQNSWVFLMYHAFPSIPLSICHSQPTTDETASSSRFTSGSNKSHHCCHQQQLSPRHGQFRQTCSGTSLSWLLL